jgi:hypothetical protein
MRAAVLAIAVIGVVSVSWRWGSFVAGGSDSYCYVHQAERWASGRLRVVEPMALDAPWPEAPLSFAPAGHIPSPTARGALAPMCPAGLSMAMAPLMLAGGPYAGFLVLPLFGALLVVGVYVVGSRFGAAVGVVSAILVSSSPIVLYQVVQPMSDVPAAALWVLAVAGATGTRPRSGALAGLATSAAVLVRPNLVALGCVIGLFLLLRPERTWGQRSRAAAIYAVCSSVGCIAVAVLHQVFYGSPLASGYGPVDALFAVEHIGKNLGRYVTWMVDTHTPAIMLAFGALWLLPGGLSALLTSLALVNLMLYLPYVVFEDWSYLRFLLPAVAFLQILLAAVIDAAGRRTGSSLRHLLGAAAVAALAASSVKEARERQAFELQRLESRFERAGLFVADRLPANAIVITSWQSGSVRFYSGRKTLVWDGLDPAWLDRAVAHVRARGFEPYLLFERWEEPLFRERFSASPLAALDWPPLAEIASSVRIYRPNDRGRYLKGEPMATEYAR